MLVFQDFSPSLGVNVISVTVQSALVCILFCTSIAKLAILTVIIGMFTAHHENISME